MSPSRWLVSVFLAWHVTALVIGSVPAPDREQRLAAQPTASRPTHLTRVLDVAAGWLPPVSRAVWRTAWPVEKLASVYMDALGLKQDWRMFVNPPKVDEYLRLRYYIAEGGGAAAPSWSSRELVQPAHPEYQVRLIESYRDSYLDKALTVALYDFRRHGTRRGHDRGITEPAHVPDDLAPVARYFARRYAQAYLLPNERIVRTEIWYGSASNPPPGATLTAEERALRVAVLQDYYTGPIQERGRISAYPSYGDTEQEADITWVLEYMEQR